MARVLLRQLAANRWAASLLNSNRISAKLGLVTARVGVLGFASIALAISMLISLQFANIENQDNAEAIFRANAKSENLKSNIEKQTKDWALWTDTYNYIDNANQKYLDVNVHSTEALAYGVEGIGYFRFDKTPRAVVYYNRKDGRPVPEMVRFLRALGQSDALIARARARSRNAFFARHGNRVLAVAAVQVTLSDGSGTPAGFIMMAHEVDAASYSEALQVSATLDTQMPVSQSSGPLGASLGADNRVHFRIGMPGLDGSPVAVVTYSKDRAIIEAGHRLQLTMIAGVALLLVLLLATLTFAINRSLVAPLHGLKRHVDQIGQTGELVEMVHDGRRDEIGALAEGFNRMIAQLRDLRARMEAQSFQIGKNQSAIGSLHNVNNGLCPIKTLLSLLPQDLAFPAREFVNRALAELAAPNLTAARRQQLTAFVVAAIERVVEQLAEAQTKVSEANRAINLVVDTISAQSASAQAAGDSAACDLTAVVGSNLAIATYNGKGFAIAVDYADEQRRLVHGDRVLISQVVGNVLTNAVEAIAASRRNAGQIRIAGSTVMVEGRRMERIAITDNGDGFDPATAADLFKRGFSTRMDKHGGLGLHWCANTINAMGGTLTIESDGPGTGATTTVTLPAYAEQAEAPIAPAAAA